MSADKCVLILHSVSYVQLYRQRQVASIYPAITRSFSCVPYSFFHLYSFPGTRFGLLDPCREYRFAGCILGSGDCSGIHISVWLTICLCRWACCLYCPIQNLKILVFYVLISFRMESLGGGGIWCLFCLHSMLYFPFMSTIASFNDTMCWNVLFWCQL